MLMRGAARPGSYQNQWKGMAISKPKPRRNRSNTIPNANKTIPAETPIIPATLIARPIMIPLSAITDLLDPSHSITSSARVSSALSPFQPKMERIPPHRRPGLPLDDDRIRIGRQQRRILHHEVAYINGALKRPISLGH